MKNTKEVSPMVVATSLRKPQDDLLRAMDEFIESLRSQPEDQAREQAILALARTGVITESGDSKEKIVSWE